MFRRARASDAARLAEIGHRCQELAAVIGAPPERLPTLGSTIELAHPHLEVHGDVLAWVTVERGQETIRRETRDLDELLYWTFASVTRAMALEWELHHRVPDQDTRIGWLTKQLELLGRLSPAWEARLREDY